MKKSKLLSALLAVSMGFSAFSSFVFAKDPIITEYYTNDFSEAQDFEIYGTEAESDGEVSVSDGKLVISGGDAFNWGDDYGYVYLPFYNENAEFRVDFDLEVSSIADMYCENGIIINSSTNDEEFSDGNLIKFFSDFAEETVFEDGEQTALENGIGKITLWDADYTAHITVDVKADGKVRLLIDDEEVYARTGGLKNSAGYMGFFFSDTVYTVDNFAICHYEEEEVTYEEVSFTYEENFDDYEDGTLPNGWTLYNHENVESQTSTAYVEDGALIFDANGAWTGMESFLVNETLGKVKRDAYFTMEMDISYGGEAQFISGSGFLAGPVWNMTVKNDYVSDFAGARIETKESADPTYQKVQLDEAKTTDKSDIGGTVAANYGAGGTIHIKVVAAGNRSPKVLLNGVETNKGYTMWPPQGSTEDWTKYQGLVGISACNACVKIDNFKISGNRVVASNELEKYDASFNTENTSFVTEKAAKAAVVVTETTADGTVVDITDKVELIASTDAFNVCTIKVLYYGALIKTLTCSMAEGTVKGFVYEENFDTYENGILPEDWKLYKHKDLEAQTSSAYVQDGALIFDANGAWAGMDCFLLIDALGKVKRDNDFRMEMEISYAGPPQYTGGAGFLAGPVWDVQLSDNYVSSYGGARMATNKLFDDKTIQRLQLNEITVTEKSDISGKVEASYPFNGTIKVTLAFVGNRSPIVYLNDVEATGGYAMWPHAGQDWTTYSGFIGIAANNSCIKIDNVKISGNHKAEDTEEGFVKVTSKKAAGEKLYIRAAAENLNADIKNAIFVAAVYEKATGKLVATSEVKAWNAAKYGQAEVAFEIDGLADYSDDAYDVKVMAMGTGANMAPVAENAAF